MADGGGFSGTVGAQESEYFTLGNGKGKIEDSPAPAIISGQMINLNDFQRYSSL
jgi:hypothetical protein